MFCSIKNGSNGREGMNEGTLKSFTRFFFHHQTLFIMQKLLCILMNKLCLPWSNKDDTNLCMTTAALQRSKRIKCKLLYGDDRMWHLCKKEAQHPVFHWKLFSFKTHSRFLWLLKNISR